MNDYAGVTVTSTESDTVELQFCTSYLGKSYESYVVKLMSTNDTPLSVVSDDLPYFLPVQQIEASCQSGAGEAMRQEFVWSVYRHLHAYVSRRQETLLAKVCCLVCA